MLLNRVGPHAGHSEQIPQLPLSRLLQTHQHLFALGHPLDNTLHFGQQLHHALTAHCRLTATKGGPLVNLCVGGVHSCLQYVCDV